VIASRKLVGSQKYRDTLHIAVLQQVKFVMKGGTVVKDALTH
jgi:hypothetical protein